MVAWLTPSEIEGLEREGQITFSTEEGTGKREIVWRAREPLPEPLRPFDIRNAPAPRKGFRTPPINPGKRIKSRKPKKR